MTTETKTCFVIMPFSATGGEHTEDYWTSLFENILKPYIEGAGSLQAIRSTALRADLVDQIIKYLYTSPVVVADLTDKNPNVYWELGIRQSFRNGTVTIIEEGNQLPFDVSGKGTLYYCPSDPFKMEKFKKELQQSVEDCLVNPDTPDSRVLQSITGRGSLFQMFRRDETLRRLDALLSEVSLNKHTINYYANASDHGPVMPLFVERFRTMAIELLVVNRYLDEDEPFYDIAGEYLYLMEYINQHAGRRSDLRTFFRQPFVSGTSPLEIVRRFEYKIDNVRKKLISQV